MASNLSTPPMAQVENEIELNQKFLVVPFMKGERRSELDFAKAMPCTDIGTADLQCTHILEEPGDEVVIFRAVAVKALRPQVITTWKARS